MEQNNREIVDKVVEMTVSKLSNSTISPCKEGGEKVAEFMQVIYDKLVELYEKD